MVKLRRMTSNPWVIGIGTTIISTLILRLIDTVAGTNLTSIVWHFLLPIWKFAVFALNVQAPVWLLLVALLFGVGILYFKKKTNGFARPAFINYTEDIFPEGILYRWEYLHKKNRYSIGKIAVYCAVCVCRFVDRKCPVCKAFLVDQKDKREVEALIRYNVEKKFGLNEFREIKEK